MINKCLLLMLTFVGCSAFVWNIQITIPNTTDIVSSNAYVSFYKKQNGELCLAWTDKNKSIIRTAYISTSGDVVELIQESPEAASCPSIITFLKSWFGDLPVFFVITESGDNKNKQVNGRYLYCGKFYNPDKICYKNTGGAACFSTFGIGRCLEIGNMLWTLTVQGDSYKQVCQILAYSRTIEAGKNPFTQEATSEEVWNGGCSLHSIVRAVIWHDSPCMLCYPGIDESHSSWFSVRYRNPYNDKWTDIRLENTSTYDQRDIAANNTYLYVTWISKDNRFYITVDRYKMNDDGSVSKEEPKTYFNHQPDLSYFRAVSTDIDSKGNAYVAFLRHDKSNTHSIWLWWINNNESPLQSDIEKVCDGLPDTPCWWSNQTQFIHLVFDSNDNPTIFYYDYDKTLLGCIGHRDGIQIDPTEVE